jgi:hypothetical protein
MVVCRHFIPLIASSCAFFLSQIALPDFIGTVDSVIFIGDMRLDQGFCDLSRAFAYYRPAL